MVQCSPLAQRFGHGKNLRFQRGDEYVRRFPSRLHQRANLIVIRA
jgi:hypothetical protein